MFYRSIGRISEMCNLLGFLFVIIHANYQLLKILQIECPISLDINIVLTNRLWILFTQKKSGLLSHWQLNSCYNFYYIVFIVYSKRSNVEAWKLTLCDCLYSDSTTFCFMISCQVLKTCNHIERIDNPTFPVYTADTWP